jgi:hypothetical protein
VGTVEVDVFAMVQVCQPEDTPVAWLLRKELGGNSATASLAASEAEVLWLAWHAGTLASVAPSVLGAWYSSLPPQAKLHAFPAAIEWGWGKRPA